MKCKIKSNANTNVKQKEIRDYHSCFLPIKEVNKLQNDNQIL